MLPRRAPYRRPWGACELFKVRDPAAKETHLAALIFSQPYLVEMVLELSFFLRARQDRQGKVGRGTRIRARL